MTRALIVLLCLSAAPACAQAPVQEAPAQAGRLCQKVAHLQLSAGGCRRGGHATGRQCQ